MSVYKELDPELAWKLIEGYHDELTPESKAQEAFYRQFRCPRCKGELQQEVDPKHVFSDSESLVGRSLLRCPTCSYLVDPHTNIILESGSPAKMPVETIPIINPEGD